MRMRKASWKTGVRITLRFGVAYYEGQISADTSGLAVLRFVAEQVCCGSKVQRRTGYEVPEGE